MEDLFYGLIAPIIVPILIFGLLIYLYIIINLKLIKLAKRFGITKNLWLIWIPFLNGYIIYQMADTKIWTFILSLLFFVPIINLSVYIMPVVWYWRIAKKLDYPAYWGLIWPFFLIILDMETEDDSIIIDQKTNTDKAKKGEEDTKRWNTYTIIQGVIVVVIIILILYLLVRS